MYYLFFNQSDPNEVQKLIAPFKNNPNVGKLGKIIIGGEIPEEKNGLIISGPEEINQANLLKSVSFLDGQPAFRIWEK